MPANYSVLKCNFITYFYENFIRFNLKARIALNKLGYFWKDRASKVILIYKFGYLLLYLLFQHESEYF